MMEDQSSPIEGDEPTVQNTNGETTTTGPDEPTTDPTSEGASNGTDPPSIHKATGPKNASMGGKTPKDRSKFRSDQKLKDLLATADEISSLEHFMYWKDEFLHTFQEYLDPEESANAREADEKLYVRMQKLAKICLNVKELCTTGAINAQAITVKGQRALNDFISELGRSEKSLHEYFPKTLEDEALVKYNKFNLAAVLVRDGFRVYDLMVTTRDYIVSLRDNELSPPTVLTANHRSVILYYLKEIESFCDCLADLGMYKLMNKCVELYKVRPRKPKKKPFDRKTMNALSDTEDETTVNAGRMFRRSKTNFKSIMDQGWTSGVTRKEVKPRQAPGVAVEKKTAPTRPMEDEPRPDPRKPNDWIYYYDPTTDKVGKIPRRRAVAENFIVTKDESGKEIIDSRIDDWDGPDGKSKLIWKLKDACKGKAKSSKG